MYVEFSKDVGQHRNDMAANFGLRNVPVGSSGFLAMERLLYLVQVSEGTGASTVFSKDNTTSMTYVSMFNTLNHKLSIISLKNFNFNEENLRLKLQISLRIIILTSVAANPPGVSSIFLGGPGFCSIAEADGSETLAIGLIKLQHIRPLSH